MKDKTILELKNTLDKSNVEDAERMLRSFYRTIEPYYKRDWRNPQRISWELYAEKDNIGFYAVVPKNSSRMIKSRIVDAYPQVEITEIEKDYLDNFNSPFTARMNLKKHYMFSTNMRKDDSVLNSVLNSMSRLEDDERMLLQISLLPINDTWQGEAYRKYRNLLFHGEKPKKIGKFSLLKGVTYSIKGIFKVLEFIISEFIPIDIDKQKNTPIERAELKATQQKISLPAFNTSVRMAVESKDKNSMSTRISELANSFIELDGDNEWRREDNSKNRKILIEIRERKVERFTNNKVTTSELAPLIRLANKNVNVPEIAVKSLKTLPIPKGLEEGVYIGKGIHNSRETEIYQDIDHVDSLVTTNMVTGAMGGGKTTLITNMMLARALHPNKYSVILFDSQGDLSLDFIRQIPESELDRVVLLDYSDYDFPVSLDLLETIPTANEEHKKFTMQFAKNEMLSLFKKIWGQNIGPQSEWLMRNIITATMGSGETSFVEMFRMLIDDEFRENIIQRIKYSNSLSYSFWRNFQDNFSIAQKARIVAPLINKIGSFVEDPMIMNITGQGLGSQKYSFREMMDSGKIVVVRIPKGRMIGTWHLIGSLILSKIWLAGLSRENVDIKERRPCFLALDEAEDLVQGNDNLSIMLSQSRKFRLGMTFGFQYLSQLRHASRKVYDALIGNKPNIFAMKIGENDASIYEESFKGYYSREEMGGFPDLHGIAKINIRGTYSTPFTFRTPYNFFSKDNSERVYNDESYKYVVDNSRRLYAQPVDEVEKMVKDKYIDILNNLELGEEDNFEDGLDESPDDLLEKLRSI